MAYTVTYTDEGADRGGWTSFHSFIPDWMQRLNNRFFTVKDGQLYLHNDENNPIRNNFYGVQYPTTLKMIVNEFPHEIKFAKTVKIESNKAFDVDIRSYISDETISITESSLSVDEFVEKEGLQYAYFRRNEIASDLTAKNAYGLGRVDSVAGSIIILTQTVPLGSISIGDKLLDESQNEIGTILGYDEETITVDTLPIIAPNTFLLGYKNTRIEGSEIRGYNFELDLTDDTSSRTELFAVNVGVSKSFPS